MSTFVDRRKNPRDKNIHNRQKFIQRSRDAIKQTVRKIVQEGSVKSIGEDKIKVKIKSVSEPTFSVNPKTGNRKYVLPGNDEYVPGDRISKPREDGGSGRGKQGSKEGEGNDDFEFLLSEDEFVDFLFEELELPYLIKKQMKTMTQVTYQRAGHKTHGNPSQLDIVKSLKNSLGRRIGLRRPKNEEIEELEEQERQAEMLGDFGEQQRLAVLIEEAKRRQVAVPWIDPFDVRYRNQIPVPKPITQAVMVCIMDVSASMGEKEKDIAKRFFLLLHLFLKRKYKKIDVVFISHHSTAKEVDEKTFFHSTETGGTIVSTSLKLANEILKERYKLDDWNIYEAQPSDGDNYSGDDEEVKQEMEQLLPKTQYFAYIEILNASSSYNAFGIETAIWNVYKQLAAAHSHMQMRQVFDKSGVWGVFAELFAKEKVKHGKG